MNLRAFTCMDKHDMYKCLYNDMVTEIEACVDANSKSRSTGRIQRHWKNYPSSKELHIALMALGY